MSRSLQLLQAAERWRKRLPSFLQQAVRQVGKLKFNFQMEIRKGSIQDLQELQKLFAKTITESCKDDYSKDQIFAWISSIDNKEYWEEILLKQFVLVAQVNKRIVGFCSLEENNYVDLLYVSNDYQRKGIAYKLYSEIENEAKRLNQIEIACHTSKTAKVFFEKMGFKLLNENNAIVKEVEMTNYYMKKKLTDKIPEPLTAD